MSISTFKYPYDWMSNFYLHEIQLNNKSGTPKTYATVEHYYQSQKAKHPSVEDSIRTAKDPAKAKAQGRRCQMDANWEDIKLLVMTEGLCAKFKDETLKQKLIDTKEFFLREGNTWNDKYWGMVRSKGEWIGQNFLGRLLMMIRTRLQENIPLDEHDIVDTLRFADNKN